MIKSIENEIPRHRKPSSKRRWMVVFRYIGNKKAHPLFKDWYEDKVQKYRSKKAAIEAIREWRKNKHPILMDAREWEPEVLFK